VVGRAVGRTASLVAPESVSACTVDVGDCSQNGRADAGVMMGTMTDAEVSGVADSSGWLAATRETKGQGTRMC
jgi:hypothetical protein